MTLKRLYSELSKIIDEESKTNEWLIIKQKNNFRNQTINK